MKKIIILILGLTLCSLNGFSQEKLKFNLENSYLDTKNRILYTDSTKYTILIQERLHNGYFRMLLFKDNTYYDCIFSKGNIKNRPFLYIVFLNK